MESTALMTISVRRLTSGFWLIRGDGPCEWAQPPTWPCDEQTLRSHMFPEASEFFVTACMELAAKEAEIAEQQRAIQAEKDAKEAADRAERERVEAEQQAKQTEESRRIADRLELIRLQCSGMYYWQLDEVLCAIEELLAKWAGEQ